jgi:citrate lyase synthetase
MTAAEPHTEEVHLMERIRLVADGKFMENVVVVEDRHALTSAYTFNRYYKKLTEEMAEDVCNEDPEVWNKYKYDALKKIIDRAKQVK